MRKGILLLFVCLVVGTSAKAQEIITLQEAVDIAVENNYQLKQARNNLDLADQRVFGEKADFLPSISARFSGNRSVGQTFNNITLRYEERMSNSINGSISASMPIFQGFNNILSLRQSESSRESQEANLERIKQTIIFNAASQYLQVLVNKELLEIARQTLETSQKQLEQVAAQVEVGSVPQVDQYNQEATVATNELTVIQRENTLEQSKLTLIRTLQLDPTGSFEFQIPDINEENVTPRQYNLQELTEQALASRSDLEAQRQTIESNRYNLQMARWSLYPSISASFSLGSSYQDLYRGLEVINGQPRQIIVGFGDQFFDQRVGRSVGFSVNIPIFSNWNTRLSVQQAQVTYKNSQLSLENQRYGVMEEVRQAYSDYTSYRKQLQSSSVALRAAQRSFETQQQRYNVGAGTLIELSSAQQSYTQAQADHANALYRLIFQEQLLEYYLGQMDTDIQLQN